MPQVVFNGASIYYETSGSGEPLVLVYEFAGDLRSWNNQANFFASSYRVIAYNARGYPPSEVPPDARHYSQEQATEDLAALLHHLGIEQAHI